MFTSLFYKGKSLQQKKKIIQYYPLTYVMLRYNFYFDPIIFFTKQQHY